MRKKFGLRKKKAQKEIASSKERVLETIGILLIGDGLVAALEPKRHGRLWLAGPKPWRKAVRPFVDSPALMRLAGLGEAAAGFWLAHRQQPR